jgi:NADPH:quinone reductase-like Zn-dependent oxidoreductase
MCVLVRNPQVWDDWRCGLPVIISATPQLLREDLKLLGELATKGEMRPVIDRTYALNDIIEAHRYVDNGHKRGNVVITVT